MSYDPKRDYYEILQVQPGAEPKVIDFAYKALQTTYHPDKPGGFTQKSQLLNEAVSVLRDSSKRAQYDSARNEYIAREPASSPNRMQKDKQAVTVSESPPCKDQNLIKIKIADLVYASLMERHVEFTGTVTSFDPTFYYCPSLVEFQKPDGKGTHFHYFLPHDDLFVWAAASAGNALDCAASTLTSLLCHRQQLEGRDLRVILSDTVRALTLSARTTGDGCRDVTVYLVGGDPIKPGETVRVRGYVKRHPTTNAAVILATSVERVTPAVEEFKITPDLCRAFEEWSHTDYIRIVRKIAHSVSDTEGREEVAMATLLALHSPVQFKVGPLSIDHGWLEIGILGNGRRAASAIVQGILRPIGLGTYALATTATRAGLSYNQADGSKSIHWGILPSNDLGLVVLDYCQEAAPQIREQLLDIGPDGVVCTGDIVPARVFARTRIIWIFHPPEGRRPDDNAYPAEALAQLFPPAFIRRLDLVVKVATRNDVTVNNKRTDPAPKQDDGLPAWVTAKLVRAHVLWVWSRKPDQISFMPDAERALFRRAGDLANEFGHCAGVPLLNPVDVSEKLARLSVAFAALAHSTTIDHEQIVVRPDDVDNAVVWILLMYGQRRLDLAGQSKKRSVTKKTGRCRRVRERCK